MIKIGRSASPVLNRFAPTLGLVLSFWLLSMLLVAFAAPISVGTGEPELIVGVLTAPATFGLTGLFIACERRRLANYGFVFSASAEMSPGSRLGTG